MSRLYAETKESRRENLGKSAWFQFEVLLYFFYNDFLREFTFFALLTARPLQDHIIAHQYSVTTLQ